jgi:hypothetical protein
MNNSHLATPVLRDVRVLVSHMYSFLVEIHIAVIRDSPERVLEMLELYRTMHKDSLAGVDKIARSIKSGRPL